eukprot:GHVN01073368.1.p2 GENE.GHVN01073368.1~~GHVN01073368.1.p2  ORF type:complete len:144 (+),score=11.72 GHVN01073368.1:61-492(+)
MGCSPSHAEGTGDVQHQKSTVLLNLKKVESRTRNLFGISSKGVEAPAFPHGSSNNSFQNPTAIPAKELGEPSEGGLKDGGKPGHGVGTEPSQSEMRAAWYTLKAARAESATSRAFFFTKLEEILETLDPLDCNNKVNLPSSLQ